MGGFAWVTLATNDSYSLGALVLANSLKQVGTKHQLAVLVTPGITSAMRDKLATVFDVVQEVNILDSRDETNLRLLKRPELGITFTKLHCWRLTQFEKCVFLDADTLVLQNSDELFEREELSAAPDVGWPDCFNSGVFVYRPSLETYDSLIQFALERGSFDGGDQGLLNLFFSDWAHKDINKHLPFIYNVCSTACYSYLPAFKQFGANAKIVHFIGSVKPWLQYFNTETKKVHPSGDATHVTEFLQRWWDLFCAFIHPQLSPAMQGQSQHRSNPVYVPPQYDPPVPNPENLENNWDPWDEYDLKVAQNPPVSVSFNSPDSQPVEFYQEPEVTLVPKESSYVPQPETVYRVLTPPPSEIHKEPEVSQIIQYTQHEHHTSKDSGQSQNENNSNIDNQQPSDVLYVDRSSDVKDDFINNDQIPQSPNKSDLRPETPLLPCECETTASVTSDISLTNTTAEDIVPQENAGLAGAFSQLTLGVARTAEQDALENVLRKQAWEVGSIDYLGKDSFENIWSKISQTLSAASAPQESQTPAPPAEPVVPSTPAPVDAPVPVPVVAPATPPVAAPTTPPVAAPASPPVATPTPAPATPPVAAPTPAPATPSVAAPSPAPVDAPVSVPVAAPTTPPVAAPASPPVASPTPAPATPPVAAPTPAPATPPVAAPSPAPVVAPVPVPVAAPTPAPAIPPVVAPAAEAASSAPAPPSTKKAAQKATSKSPAAKPGPAPPSAE